MAIVGIAFEGASTNAGDSVGSPQPYTTTVTDKGKAIPVVGSPTVGGGTVTEGAASVFIEGMAVAFYGSDIDDNPAHYINQGTRSHGDPHKITLVETS